MTRTQEAKLVSRAVTSAQGGDREAIRFLYVHYAADVHGYLRSIVRNEHDAEDLTQHVFAKLMKDVSKYQPHGGVPFKAWLLRVARNAALDSLRSRRPVPVAEVFGADAACDHDPDRLETLKDALAELPEEQRTVLIMRHLGGFSPPEIAAHMGRSEGSVHGLHHRARGALKKSLVTSDAAPVTLSA